MSYQNNNRIPEFSPQQANDLRTRQAKYDSGLDMSEVTLINKKEAFVMNKRGEKVILDSFDLFCILECGSDVYEGERRAKEMMGRGEL